MRLVGITKTTLAEVPGIIGVKVSKKLEAVLNKNPGYGTLKSIGDALEGKSPTTNIPPQFTGKFCYATLTSAEVERTFSTLKNTLTDWRLNFAEEHSKWHLVLVSTCEDE